MIVPRNGLSNRCIFPKWYAISDMSSIVASTQDSNEFSWKNAFKYRENIQAAIKVQYAQQLQTFLKRVIKILPLLLYLRGDINNSNMEPESCNNLFS